MGQHDGKRTKQADTFPGQMEGTKQNIYWHSVGNGEPMDMMQETQNDLRERPATPDSRQPKTL